ncbi:alpha-hydroxy acid oxidase [Bordetella flabilis]|uniref:Alpha-hydroxy-acid oxidizing enzyme n=1 Tax=Bordetella flabilis TaxID=463014 RepID=A0A193GG91_9BORD|nr:alpha-hydroxy acid oxidase [Bordetella flabilis]ANN78618.1 alpha-hydroxy-acid oxidizing enzyme [Bordetella flabilis]
MRVEQALSIADLQQAARRRLPPGIYGYVHGGSEDQSSLRANREAYDRWRFVPRPLVDVSSRALSVTLLGRHYAAPLGISPMGVAGLCGFDGDVAMAAAAREAGVPFVLSAASTTPLERVVQAYPDLWYQGYLPARGDIVEPLLQRVWAAGVRVLVVTVDVPIASVRENELRNGFSIPLRLGPRLVWGGLCRPTWMVSTFARTLLRHGMPHFENFTATRGGPIISAAKGDHRAGRAAMTWREIAWIREKWQGRLLVKGILHAADAGKARAIGLDGIFVSNHGGRQLDGALASLDALPAIAEAASGMTVLLDGGARRGTDVLKAMALGAHAVFVGRPAMYGLAAGGRRGVLHALRLLSREIDVDLALLGCPDVAQLGPHHLCRADTPAVGAQPAARLHGDTHDLLSERLIEESK